MHIVLIATVLLIDLCYVLIDLMTGASIVRDATGIESNVTLIGLNCTGAACKFGYNFNSCRTIVDGESACKFGLHNDFQVRHRQQTWPFLHYLSLPNTSELLGSYEISFFFLFFFLNFFPFKFFWTPF